MFIPVGLARIFRNWRALKDAYSYITWLSCILSCIILLVSPHWSIENTRVENYRKTSMADDSSQKWKKTFWKKKPGQAEQQAGVVFFTMVKWQVTECIPRCYPHGVRRISDFPIIRFRVFLVKLLGIKQRHKLSRHFDGMLRDQEYPNKVFLVILRMAEVC